MTLLVPSDLYNRWFTTPVSTAHIEVDYVVMNELMRKLPKGYVFPDPATMHILTSENN
ncbi:hypothetical protein JNUCC31_08410 [Paenibacillus sp. JNUCC31]|uniref:hypothetical protein n=1 Tax=Paenibacillus sp. JNUCC-31 TaxID=2777983 RepID=UPI0017804C08|nr:hypothetical protein [Paenibacillus sp. JNUCC-31]QOS80878.1 hypothetical protein JNUCC31_08410 [Paenibacillus sp. JNUCC-31]